MNSRQLVYVGALLALVSIIAMLTVMSNNSLPEPQYTISYGICIPEAKQKESTEFMIDLVGNTEEVSYVTLREAKRIATEMYGEMVIGMRLRNVIGFIPYGRLTKQQQRLCDEFMCAQN